MTKKKLIILVIPFLIIIFYIGFIFSPFNNLCKVIPEDITFKDISNNGFFVREYSGVLRTDGSVNTNLKGLTGRLYSKNNKIISESYFAYKNIKLSLTEKIAFNLRFEPNSKTTQGWISEIDHFEFIPSYSCSSIGYYR